MKNTQTDIREELKKLESILRRHYFSRTIDLFEIKIGAMRGNTARAFKQGKCYNNYKPTSILKNWLHYHYFGDPATFQNLKSGSDFEAIHEHAVDGLKDFWTKIEPNAPGIEYYHFAKMIDLLFKSIPRWDELSSERQEWFFQRVHVPIDKYSLMILREFHPNYTIPSPSMNYVEDKAHYIAIQKDIRELIAPFPPLLFDLYAWDHRRKEQLRIDEQFELIPASKQDG